MFKTDIKMREMWDTAAGECLFITDDDIRRVSNFIGGTLYMYIDMALCENKARLLFELQLNMSTVKYWTPMTKESFACHRSLLTGRPLAWNRSIFSNSISKSFKIKAIKCFHVDWFISSIPKSSIFCKLRYEAFLVTIRYQLVTYIFFEHINHSKSD